MKKTGCFRALFAIVLSFVLLFSAIGCTEKSTDVGTESSSEAVATESTGAENTSSTESEEDSKMYEGKTKIKVMSYNIRCLQQSFGLRNINSFCNRSICWR